MRPRTYHGGDCRIAPVSRRKAVPPQKQVGSRKPSGRYCVTRDYRCPYLNWDECFFYGKVETEALKSRGHGTRLVVLRHGVCLTKPRRSNGCPGNKDQRDCGFQRGLCVHATRGGITRQCTWFGTDLIRANDRLQKCDECTADRGNIPEMRED